MSLEDRLDVALIATLLLEAGWSRNRFGDGIMQNFRDGHPDFEAFVNARLAEGVTEEDIWHFWNLSPATWNAVMSTDDKSRAFTYHLEKANTGDETWAVDKALRDHPFYGDPDNPERIFVGDSRPLFPELKTRVNRWLRRGSWRYRRKRNELDYLARGYDSLNALIRGEIRAGRL